MAFFSKDLTFSKLYKNTTFGVYTVIEELYWLYADTFFQCRKKKLEKQCEEYKACRDIISFANIEEKLVALSKEHDELRKLMVEKRVRYLD